MIHCYWLIISYIHENNLQLSHIIQCWLATKCHGKAEGLSQIHQRGARCGQPPPSWNVLLWRTQERFVAVASAAFCCPTAHSVCVDCGPHFRSCVSFLRTWNCQASNCQIWCNYVKQVSKLFSSISLRSTTARAGVMEPSASGSAKDHVPLPPHGPYIVFKPTSAREWHGLSNRIHLLLPFSERTGFCCRLKLLSAGRAPSRSMVPVCIPLRLCVVQKSFFNSSWCVDGCLQHIFQAISQAQLMLNP